MTKTAEDYLNELPYRIIKNVVDVCPVCGNSTRKREVIYKLKLDIFPFEHKPHAVKLCYRLYYYTGALNIPDKNKIIGLWEHFKTIKEAVEALKEYLKSEGISK